MISLGKAKGVAGPTYLGKAKENNTVYMHLQNAPIRYLQLQQQTHGSLYCYGTILFNIEIVYFFLIEVAS